jgi:hypothetical protein
MALADPESLAAIMSDEVSVAEALSVTFFGVGVSL